MVRSLTAFPAAICVALSSAASAAVAEDVTGVWKTKPRSGGAYITVKIAPCATNRTERCGTVVGAYHGARPEMIGEEMLKGLKPQENGTWSDGEIINPKSGEAYHSKLKRLSADTLEVKGCVVGGLICSGQDWTLVK